MKITQAYNDFILACRADGLRPATVKWYASILKPLVVHFAGVQLEDVTTKQMRLYIIKLMERDTRYAAGIQKPPQKGGLTRDTLASHIRALHRFWNWCTSEYNLQFNPMQHIKRPPKPQKLPKAINSKDLIKLFEATGENLAGIRDRALLAFLADTGARLGGVQSLTMENVFIDSNKAYVIEKGEILRVVVYSSMTSALIGAWIAQKPAGDYLFCHIKSGEMLTSTGINEILKRLKQRAGVTGRVNPHSFRHNFAREYLKNGGNIVYLKELMGHKDINTTIEYYAIFTPDELAQKHDEYSPLTNLDERI